MAEMLVHPDVYEHLNVARTEFWGKNVKEGEKVKVGYSDRDLIISNAAAVQGAGKLHVHTDKGVALLANLTPQTPSTKVWFRVKAGSETVIVARSGDVDVIGYTVSDVEEVDPDQILPPINLPVDKYL